jgi:hypothetical protein
MSWLWERSLPPRTAGNFEGSCWRGRGGIGTSSVGERTRGVFVVAFWDVRIAKVKGKEQWEELVS